MEEVKVIRKTKYPVIMVHGFFVRDILWFKSFGKLIKKLHEKGYTCYKSNVDAFGSIETNADILKKEIEQILVKEGAEKINIIAHSKGGLDSRYAISKLGLNDKVANLITICTPHGGSVVADQVMNMPKWIIHTLNFLINTTYKILGDQKPNARKGGLQLTTKSVKQFNEDVIDNENVRYLSYSSVLRKDNDDFFFSIVRKLFRKIRTEPNDGLVTVESSKHGIYLGEATQESLSHRQIIDYIPTKKFPIVFEFYMTIFDNLINAGF